MHTTGLGPRYLPPLADTAWLGTCLSHAHLQEEAGQKAPGAQPREPHRDPGSVAALYLSPRLQEAPHTGLRTERPITDQGPVEGSSEDHGTEIICLQKGFPAVLLPTRARARCAGGRPDTEDTRLVSARRRPGARPRELQQPDRPTPPNSPQGAKLLRVPGVA